MRHSKPTQLETAPTKHGGESVYLFFEFTIVHEFIPSLVLGFTVPAQPNLQGPQNRRRAGQPRPYKISYNLHLYHSPGGADGAP